MSISSAVEPVMVSGLQGAASESPAVPHAPVVGAAADALQMVPVEWVAGAGEKAQGGLGLQAVLSDLSAVWERSNPKNSLEELRQLSPDLSYSPSGDYLQDMRSVLSQHEQHSALLMGWQFERMTSTVVFHTAINLANSSSQNVKTLFQDK